MYMVSFTAVQYWFEKKRAMATGLVVCGSGVGTVIFSSVTQMLVDVVGWKNALRIWVSMGYHLSRR